MYLTKNDALDSCACTKTELDMESIPPTMTTMQGTQWNDYHPIASLDSHHAPIEFLIPPHTEFYTDLSQSYLYIKFRILKQTGEDLDTDAKVFPINKFFHSMFTGIDLYINNKLITNISDTYQYRALKIYFLMVLMSKIINLRQQKFGLRMNLELLKILQINISLIVAIA